MSYEIVFMDKVTDSNSDNLGGIALGTFRWDAANKKGYRRIQMYSGESLVSGNLGYHYAGQSAFVISDDLTNGKRNLVAGVATATQTSAYYGWLQTKGLHTTVTKLSGAGNNWVIGDRVIASSTALAAIQEDAGTAPTYKAIGTVWATAASTAVSGSVLLDLDP